MKKIFILLFFSSLSLLFSNPTEQLLSPLQIPFVLVGDPGNKAATSSGKENIGSVKTPFFLGKYEITAKEYHTFLSAVAAQGDPHHLYKEEMATDPTVACIRQIQNIDGTFSYELLSHSAMLPITYVSLRDAQRFCNWLENGCPTNQADPAVLAASTEEGAYKIFQRDNEEVAEFQSQAHFYIPTENEWIKAAYYKGNGIASGYWAYPTQHDTAPNSGQGDITNHANYETLTSYWSSAEETPFLTPVDCFPKTHTFYGAYDMGGNVAEWTCHRSAENSSEEIVRGGSWKSRYSIWGSNDLMRVVEAPSYAPFTANNFIGFRLASTAPASSPSFSVQEEECHNDANTESYLLWTATRGLFIGCPRMMTESAFKFFGYNACSLLGVQSIASNSIQVLGAIFLTDFVGYLMIMTALTAISDLVPWAYGLIKSHFFEKNTSDTNLGDLSTLPQLTLSDAIPSSFKAVLGCGMCQMTLLFTTLKTLLSGIGISTNFLTSLEDSILDLQLTEIPYLPGWVMYNGIPVLAELGLFLVFLEVCHEIYYYWPAFQDTLLQFWYSSISSLL